MKAYVIKNKEGKYWQWLFNNEPDWEEKLYNGFMHYSQKDAEKSIEQWQLKDCKVVEITIAEGDLEKQLAEKDKEILLLNREISTLPAHDEELRHQVCEEIREKLLRLCDWHEDEISGYWYATEKKINYVLEQIEEGESK